MFDNFETLLEDYAELLIVHGINVQPGQRVYLGGEVPHRELLLKLSEKAYKRGAEFVDIDIHDQRFSRVRLDHSEEKYLEALPEYYRAKNSAMVDEGAATLRVVGPEFPEALLGANPEKVNTVRKASYLARKRFYDEGIDQSKVQWNVAAGATPLWAKRIYTDLSEEEAVQMLWRDIFSFSRVGNGNHLELWQEHNMRLHQRAAALNAMKISELHFKSPGTDLRVGLTSIALFQSGNSKTDKGVSFEANIPTEECFTTPDWRKCSGKVSATRPFYVNGVLIEGLVMTLNEGEITDFSAKSGSETFQAYISSDEGAKRIGEIALVGIDSPIYKTGKVYQEILLDENAACHIAVGSGYRFCLDLPPDTKEEEWNHHGCNSSSVHTDIMISSEETTVTATDQEGNSRVIISEGEWSNEL